MIIMSMLGFPNIFNFIYFQQLSKFLVLYDRAKRSQLFTVFYFILTVVKGQYKMLA